MINKLIILSALVLGGCDQRTSNITETTDRIIYSKVCIGGVYYYTGTRKIAVAYNTDSTVKLCEVNNNE